MNDESAVLGRSRIDIANFEPLVLGGERHGEVHFIRNDELDRGPYRVAVWRLESDDLPYESPYEFVCDETVYIVEGSLEMTLESGEKLMLEAGDIVCMRAGTKSQWVITEPFKKLVVET